MGITNEMKKGQYGLTLVELLISISISGMLLLAVFQFYSSVQHVWSSASAQFRFMQNYIKIVHYIREDIHHADVIEKTTKTYLRLASDQNKIRYQIHFSPEIVSIIREIKPAESNKWIQQPRLPVSEFNVNQIQSQSLMFKKISDIQVVFNVNDQRNTFRTAFTRRN